MTRRVRKNINMFLIGVLLLTISFSYLESHPGEQQSFLPSLQMLSQRVELLRYTIVRKDSKTLEIRQQLNKIYTELSYLINSSNCASDLVDEIKELEHQIKTMDDDTLRNQQTQLIAHAQDLKQKIDEECVSKFVPTNNSTSNTGNAEEE